MFAALLKRRPLLDEDTTRWLLDTFAWAMAECCSGKPAANRPLVLPTNAFFPGRADSVHAMAQMVFSRVVEYAGMADRHLRLSAGGACAIPGSAYSALPQLSLHSSGGEMRVVSNPDTGMRERTVGYDPALVGNPEALIASFAHSLAAIRAGEAGTAPPGGPGNLPYATEVLAVTMGFGVMLANSAKTIQARSCGSCGSGQASWKSALSQYDITYALALFCHHEGIAGKEAAPHLDRHLRPFFRKALKEVDGRRDQLEPAHRPG